MKKPYEVIKIDKYTKKIQSPKLMLMNRAFDVIGNIPKYTDWNISLRGNELDEISFVVHKYTDGVLCPVWDDLVDLKIVNIPTFGTFEISVDYTDNADTVKSIHGVSFETELGQLYLNEFHVNDEDSFIGEDPSSTVFYNEADPSHSLLHRILKDKAPHWKIGHVPTHIILEGKKPEPVEEFQRTYTADNEDIYSFLTNTVATESNVIFIFTVENGQRTINCYNLIDYTYEDGTVVGDCIGEDTTVLVSKRKLANEITISSNKDNVKNCFRVVGGDDIMTDYVRAINMNGSNYIYRFADFQFQDMPEELKQKIIAYQNEMSSEEIKNEYYGENGIFTRLCQKYDDLLHYESSMMPEVTIKETDAEAEYWRAVSQLKEMTIGVSSVNNYDNNLFVGVTNNVEAMAQILVDARYKVEVIEDSTSYNSDTKKWTGNIRVTRATDDTDCFPKETSDINTHFSVLVDDDIETYTKQKIQKALAKGSMSDIDFEVEGIWGKENLSVEEKKEKIREYFNLYSLNRLKSFRDAYNSCLSILETLGQTTDSSIDKDTYDAYLSVRDELHEKYFGYLRIISNPPTTENPNPVPGVLDLRQQKVDEINSEIESIQKEQNEFQRKHDFQTYLGEDLYKIFCSYRREDTYQNDNYISDGYSTSQCLNRAKQLVEAADTELKKACVLQRTVSTSLNNLFLLPEFEPLYDKFALFNFIRVRTEDEILKLRLIGIDFNSESAQDIDVIFSEQIESVDGKMSDLQSILQQAKSISSSYSSTALQAKQGSSAKNLVSEMYNKGLNAAKTMLTNNDDNEVTMTSSGILCKRMDNEGLYGEKQFRITGNIMAFTTDAWKTLEMAIGETVFYNPYTGKYEQRYGIVGGSIVGDLIAGRNLYIGNSNGSVQITGDGIKITNGTITWGKDGEDGVNSPKASDIEGLPEFQNDVTNALTGGKTTISKDSVITPKIGGGYLYITDERTDSNGTGTSIEINPNGTTFAGHNTDYVFNIAKNDKVVMGVSNDGQGYFKGDITADSLLLNGVKYGDKDSKKISNISRIETGYMFFNKDFGEHGGYADGTSITLNGGNGFIAFSHTNDPWDEHNDETLGVDVVLPDFAMMLENNTPSFFLRGNTFIWGNVDIWGTIHASYDDLYVNGHLTCYDDLYVSGSTNIDGNTKVNGHLTFSNNNYFNAYSGGGIYCSSHFGIEGNLSIGGNIFYTGFKQSVNGSSIITGRLQVGTTEYTNSDGNYYKTSVDGSLYVSKNIWMDGVKVATTGSDFRLKQDFSSIKNIKDLYMDFKAKQYRFKDGVTGENGYHTGLIAQEVQNLFKKYGLDINEYNLVEEYTPSQNSDLKQYLSNGKALRLNYENLHAYHIAFGQEIYKELTNEIEKLKERVKELEEK